MIDQKSHQYEKFSIRDYIKTQLKRDALEK